VSVRTGDVKGWLWVSVTAAVDKPGPAPRADAGLAHCVWHSLLLASL
jgi:hypothetical protein